MRRTRRRCVAATKPAPPATRSCAGDRTLTKLELPLFGLFFACWLAAVLHNLGLVGVSAGLDLSLYQVYAVAAVLGWLSGNVYIHRRRRLPQEHKKRAAALWLMGPQGVPALLRAMAPVEAQAAAPTVPLYALGVGAVFFCVPLVFGVRTRS